MASEFMAWLRPWRVQTGSTTHLLLDGGKLNVPDDAHPLFLNEYVNAVARAMARKESLPAVVELKTDPFRLFVDLDFKGRPPDDAVHAVVHACFVVAAEVFHVSPDMVVLEPMVPVPDKRGLHLVFTNVFVTTGVARAYRERVLGALAEFPDIEWAKVFDACVYGATGLRMPFSAKGPDNHGSVYIPTARIAHPGEHRTDIQGAWSIAKMREYLKVTSIKTFGIPPTPTSLGEVTPTSTGSARVATMSAVETGALEALARCLPKPFSGQSFQSCHEIDSELLVLKSSSRVCGNIGYREHRSNNVYFVVSKAKKTVYQRCYCRCETLDHRTAGVMCKDYAGPPVPVPTKVIDALFGPNSSPEPQTGLQALLSMSRPDLKQFKVKGKAKGKHER